MNKQKNNKGLGPDDLPCEVLKAGEDVMAIRLSELGERVKKERRWPVVWKGGRIVDVLKNGNCADCDNSRGILLACHCFKVLLSLVMAPVTAVYNQMVPATQFGAVSKRGSDFATHVVLTAIDAAKRWAWSIFILFVDLSKVFDRVIREIALGIPTNLNGTLHQHLRGLGLSDRQAKWVAQFMAENGPILAQWGVHEATVALLCELHSGAWFSYGDLSTAIMTRKGGRQGCQSGGCIFNTVHAVGLELLHIAMKDASITLKLALPGNVFWLDRKCNR